MKKTTRFFLYTGMALITAFAACKKEDDGGDDSTTKTDPITATVTVVDPASGNSVPAGDYIVLHIVANGNDKNKLKSLDGTITITTPAGTQTMSNPDTSISGLLSVDRYDTIPLDAVSATYVFSGVVKGSATGSTDVNIGPFTFYTNTIDSNMPYLGNQADASPKFWSARRKASYFLADVKGNTEMQADMDFAYCTRSTGNGGNKLISPSSQDATDIYATQWSQADEKITTWAVRNTTGFIKVNSLINQVVFNNYNLSTDSLINVAKQVGEPSNPYVSIADGEIYLYRTIRGSNPLHKNYYYGLIYVSGPTGSVNGSGVAQAGSVQLIVRYQREH